jgi:two-component system chemotaxis response regulator CheB
LATNESEKPRASVKAIRVAVVDDSSFIRKALVKILSAEPRIEVVGTAESGEELLDYLEVWHPDVITLDMAMPGIGCLQTLYHIQRIRPTPVVVLSTHTGKDAPLTIEALHRGALDFIDKQTYSLVDFMRLGAVLTEKILQVAGVDFPSPRPRRKPIPGAIQPQSRPLIEDKRLVMPLTVDSARTDYRLVLIGASTGGPLAIQKVLESLPELPVPIVIVQHMPVGFTAAFAQRLNSHLPLPVREATQGERLHPGVAYVGPAGQHFLLTRSSDHLEVNLSDEPSDTSHRPSVDLLFQSAAKVVGSRAVAVLLTGMGRDGAEGLAELAAGGAHTVAQDEATSIVYGMPRVARELEAARDILPLDAIGPHTRRIVVGLK